MRDTSDTKDAWRRLRLALVRSPALSWRFAGTVPDEITAAADEPWFPTVTPTRGFAEEFYLGRIRLAGRLRECRGSPFAAADEATADPDDMWAEALHGFGWLRPLRDEGTPLARVNARAMLADWIEIFGEDLDHPAWRPRTAARRLDAWLAHHEWLVRDGTGERNDAGRARDRHLARHARALRSMAPATSGLERVEIGAALAFAQTAFGFRGRGLAHVQAGLRGALAKDGGPRSDRPREAVRLLALLRRVHADKVQADRAPGKDRESPPFLVDAANGLAGWLAALCHADGTIAQFEGTGWLPKALVPPLLKDAPTPFAERFARLEGGRGAVVVADRGRKDRTGDGAITAGFDSGGGFELSVPRGRVVVSCGVPERDGPLRAALAGSAAHSTLTVELPEGDAPGRPEHQSEPDTDGDISIVTTRGPFTHRRRLRFEDEGLAGIDEVTGKGDVPARLRFHLHPGVKAVRESPHTVSLTLTAVASGDRIGPDPVSSAARWTFHCVDAALRLEETMVFAEDPDGWSGGRGRASRQIVIDVPEGEEATRELRWMFVRHA